MMRKLTRRQLKVIQALRKRGAWFTANSAEAQWLKGERAYLDLEAHFEADLRKAFAAGNYDAVHGGQNE